MLASILKRFYIGVSLRKPNAPFYAPDCLSHGYFTHERTFCSAFRPARGQKAFHGQLDYRLDVSEGFQLFTTLQRLKVPSKMLYFPDEGHWVLKPQNSQLWYKTVNGWVDSYLKK